MANQENEFDSILKRLRSIEYRLSRLESSISIDEKRDYLQPDEPVQPANQLLNTDTPDEEEKGLESQIGQFGLAWLGNIVLLFGIAFLAQYLMNTGSRFFSFLFGYIASAAIFILANYIKKSNGNLAFIFRINAHLLLYYITVRLHFFSASPLIAQRSVSIIFLLILIAIQVYLSIRNSSQTSATLAVFFALTTSILADTTYLTIPIVTLIAAGTVYFYFRFKWETLTVVALILSYLAFIMWLFGNPLLGHAMQMISGPHIGVKYMLGLGACFSVVSLFRKKDSDSDDFLTSVTVINGILFTILLLLIVLRYFFNDYIGMFGVITICCLLYSVILHSKSNWNFASAFYALYGFLAMSIALYGIFGLPRVYLLLSIQSLLVVSMALWFRNRLIIVINSILFLTILIVYLFSSRSINSVNFSFVLIALISARIVNWKRSRLQIKTDLIRNLYMYRGFCNDAVGFVACCSKAIRNILMDNGCTSLFYYQPFA